MSFLKLFNRDQASVHYKHNVLLTEILKPMKTGQGKNPILLI